MLPIRLVVSGVIGLGMGQDVLLPMPQTVAESLGSVALSYPLEYLRTTPEPEPTGSSGP